MRFSDWLTLLFIAFKLANIISWKWIWVLSPIWIGFAFLILVAIINVIADWAK